MLDLVMVIFTGVVFYVGFWCGAKFGTFSTMAAQAKAKAKSWL